MFHPLREDHVEWKSKLQSCFLLKDRLSLCPALSSLLTCVAQGPAAGKERGQVLFLSVPPTSLSQSAAAGSCRARAGRGESTAVLT